MARGLSQNQASSLSLQAAHSLTFFMHSQPPHLNLIGCGRVGQTLARLWHDAGMVRVAGLYSKNPASAQAAALFVGAGEVCPRLQALPEAELWLIATPDTAIAEVAQQLATAHANRQPGLALHCSGFLSSAVLEPLRAQGWHAASAHPVRSFAEPALAVQGFKGTPVALEGDAPACDAARQLFEAVGARCFDIEAASKPLYHAAAVFANNFSTVLQGVAQDLWQHCGIAPDMARELDVALLASTLANLQTQTPTQALTGPAARGDAAVVQAQGEAVAQWDANAGELYALMSEMARTLKARTPKPGA
jgi:predicted short-subunit dehydrogenase-like oxidoreductase (DUF2520 family)